MKRFSLLILLATAVVWLLSVVGPFAASARASVITIGDVVPGGAATQSDPWAVGSSLKVGDSGNGMLNVEATGIVSSTKGYIGYRSGSTGEATVTGADSQWNNSVELYVGVVGDGTLKVEAGGMVSNTKGYLGYHAGSTGEATVTGTNSQWNNSGALYVGVVSNGTLNVEAEGMVSNTKGYLGYHAGSTGEATVTGTNSQWNNSGDLHVGVVGDGTLNIKAGGVVFNSTGRIGDQSGSTGKATVTGSSSQWNNSDRLVVGRSGDGTLIIEAEGVVSNNLGLIGRYSSSTGVVTVTGASSQWNNSGALHVGWYGDGTLNVKAGGMASNTSGYIGRYSGSTGEATVTDADSQWNNSNSLYIGGGSSGSGGSGTLNLNNSGLVTVSGTTKLWSDGTINLDGGTLDVGTLDLTLGTFNMLDGRLYASSVLGDLDVQGGVVRFDQDVTNQTGGFIGGRGQFVADGGWTNRGVMAFSGTADILGDVVNEIGGQIVTSGGATTTIFDDLEHNGQEIRTSADSRTVVLGQASGAGDYTGTGTVYFEGDMRPGNSSAEVSFGGNVILGPSSAMEIELGGAVRGDEYDAMIVSGNFILDGSLNVLPIDGYAPQAGDLFDLLDFEPANLSGVFDTVSLPALASGLAWDDTNLYTTGELLVLLSQIPGDFDSDGDVDGDDFLLWQRNFPILDGTAGSLRGDANGDGNVDGNDFLVWQRNFPFPVALSSVPEPNSLVLLAVGGLLILKRCAI